MGAAIGKRSEKQKPEPDNSRRRRFREFEKSFPNRNPTPERGLIGSFLVRGFTLTLNQAMNAGFDTKLSLDYAKASAFGVNATQFSLGTNDRYESDGAEKRASNLKPRGPRAPWHFSV